MEETTLRNQTHKLAAEQGHSEMSPSSQGDDQNDGVSSQPQTEETTATKRQRFTTSIGTLTSQLLSIPPSSFNPPNDSPPLPTLPFELLTEILYRLPVKFLLQLKCVCKSWKSLISDPKFAKKHLRVSTIRHSLVLSYINISREFTLSAYPLSSIFTGAAAAPMQLEYPLNNFTCYNHLVGSCDGILCFADKIHQDFVLLFNPSIRKFKKLPEMEIPRKTSCHSFPTYSFGYDHVSDDYKVVGTFGHKSKSGVSTLYKTEVRIYTLSTNCWKRIQDFPFGDPFRQSGKFVCGTINWLLCIGSGYSSFSWIIVSLDLGNESYKEILQPDYGGVKMPTLTLGVLRDCLCITSIRRTSSDIWIMKEYGNKESWTKLFTIYGPDCFDFTRALYASEDGRVLLDAQQNLVLYDSGDFTFPDIPVSWKDPEVYIESLVSPCF